MFKEIRFVIYDCDIYWNDNVIIFSVVSIESICYWTSTVIFRSFPSNWWILSLLHKYRFMNSKRCHTCFHTVFITEISIWIQVYTSHFENISQSRTQIPSNISIRVWRLHKVKVSSISIIHVNFIVPHN